MKQTAVEFLAERYNYITWLRNRDEISAGTADESRSKLLKEALNMEKMQIIHSWDNGFANGYDLGKFDDDCTPEDAQQYYDETFKSE